MKNGNKILLAILSCAIGLLWVVPYAWIIVTSVVLRPDSSHAFTRLGMDHFSDVLSQAPFAIYFLNSLVIVVGVLLLQCATTTLAAYAVARLKFWGRDFVFLLLLCQIAIPNDILIVPNYLTVSKLRLTNSLLGIMIPFFASGFGIFLFRQTFKSIPRDFEEAAEIDGAGLLRKLAYIYLPMSKPAYAAFGLASVCAHWNDFLWPLIITNSDRVRPMTVGLAMFATSFETGARWGDVAAATILVTLPLVVFFAAFQKRFVESFSFSSGIK